MKSAKYKHRLLLRLCEQQNNRCCYCGVAMLVPDGGRHNNGGKKLPAIAATIDHVIPRKNGGRGGVRNIVAACYWCNQKRGTLKAAAAFSHIQELIHTRRHPHGIPAHA